MPPAFQAFSETAPLSLPVCKQFSAWPAQLLLEVAALLQNKSPSWLNVVGEKVHALTHQVVSPLELGTLAAPSLARSSAVPFAGLIDGPGQIGRFAALEQAADWNFSPQTERWERYAVFALLSLRDAVFVLSSKEVTDPHSSTGPDVAAAYNLAGGYSHEAGRALQIVHSLRIDSETKSNHGRKAANVRHAAMTEFRERAVQMADDRTFRTKREAVDYITENLCLDEKENRFPSRRAVEEWLRQANWMPTHR